MTKNKIKLVNTTTLVSKFLENPINGFQKVFTEKGDKLRQNISLTITNLLGVLKEEKGLDSLENDEVMIAGKPEMLYDPKEVAQAAANYYNDLKKKPVKLNKRTAIINFLLAHYGKDLSLTPFDVKIVEKAKVEHKAPPVSKTGSKDDIIKHKELTELLLEAMEEHKDEYPALTALPKTRISQDLSKTLIKLVSDANLTLANEFKRNRQYDINNVQKASEWFLEQKHKRTKGPRFEILKFLAALPKVEMVSEAPETTPAVQEEEAIQAKILPVVATKENGKMMTLISWESLFDMFEDYRNDLFMFAGPEKTAENLNTIFDHITDFGLEPVANYVSIKNIALFEIGAFLEALKAIIDSSVIDNTEKTAAKVIVEMLRESQGML